MGRSFLQFAVNAALRMSCGSQDGAHYVPQSGDIVCALKQLKEEMAADGSTYQRSGGSGLPQE